MPPASRHRLDRLATHGMWLLPLLAAGITYGVTTGLARHSSGGHRPAQTAGEREIVRLSDHPDELFQAAAAEIQARDERENPPPATLGGTVLREKLLKLLAEQEREPSFEGIQQGNEWAAALIQTEGEAGMIWLEDQLPGLRPAAYEAWAEIDAGAAFDHLTTHPGNECPCSYSTLMALLGPATTRGPDALRAALERTPWNLFDPRSPILRPERGALTAGLDLPGDPEEAKTWLDSGIARSLAARGIPILGVLAAHFRDDPQRALADWASWPRFHDDDAAEELAYQLQSDYDEEGRQSMAGLFAATSPEVKAKLDETLAKMAGSNSPVVSMARVKFPNLFPPSPGTGTGASPHP